MRSKMERPDKAYRVKIIDWQEPERSFGTPVMIVEFDADYNRVLSDKGFGGTNYLFVKMESGYEAHHDPHKLSFTNNTKLDEFLKLTESGRIDFEDIEDGETYGPKDWGL